LVSPVKRTSVTGCFENRVMRILAPEWNEGRVRRRKMRDGELHNLSFSYISRMTKSRNILCPRHVARMRETLNAFKFWLENVKGTTW
jgi:hypothetical protein